MTADVAPPPDGGTGRAGPPGFDTNVAHQARMYDYLLGGKDNYAADRAAIDAQLQIYPDVAFAARANRAFLGRAVRYLTAEAGIRQFLDIGTGIPTAGNTHQVAQEIAPESRVVYVDYDPRPGQRAARLQQAGRRHADRHPARDTRIRRPARKSRQADGRRAARQPPRHLPHGDGSP